MYILSRFVLSLKKISEEGSGGSSPTEFSKRGGRGGGGEYLMTKKVYKQKYFCLS